MLRDAFAAHLALAGEKFRNGRCSADGGRHGTCLALNALIRYALAARPDVKADLESVILLATKLEDVGAGKVDRMFKPPRRKGRAPPSSQRKWLKQIVAVAVAVLMDERWEEPVAEDYVAGRLKEYGLEITGRTVGNWRSDVDEYRPRGVGTPGRSDEPGVTIAHPDQVDLYLERWQLWQTARSQHLVATKQPMSAKAWVDLVIFNDILWAFID